MRPSSGGMDGPLFKAVEAANAGRCELLRGQVPAERGDEKQKGVVYVAA